MRLSHLLALTASSLLALAACGGDSGDGGDVKSIDGGEGGGSRPRIAFITNMVDPFWDLARRGAEDAARELGVDLDYYAPPNATVEEQKRRVEDMLAIGIDGIAITVSDADNLSGLINEAASKTHVVTHDSDAPGTQRRCFVGCDNYAAGRACGELVREAIPDGGEIMIFVGGLGQDNAKRRRQGVIDELLGRDHDEARFDAVGAPISGNGYTILDTRTDGGDNAKAKSNAEDALVKHPEVDCMVGLFAYNPPAILAAVKAAEKQEDVKIIGFDEHYSTVQAIKAGEIHGTVSQQPYYYGYESVRILNALHGGDESVLPEGEQLKVEHKVFRQDNAQELLDLLDDVLGK